MALKGKMTEKNGICVQVAQKSSKVTLDMSNLPRKK